VRSRWRSRRACRWLWCFRSRSSSPANKRAWHHTRPRFEQGIYILDEPEAALSPQRQLSFLKIIHDLATPGHAQFLIATHSPIILSYPGAVLFSLDADTIQEISYRETKHFLITRDFLNSPESFFKHLFETVDDNGGDA